MFDTLLSCLHDFFNAHLIRHMAHDRQALLVSFCGSGQVGIMRDDRLYLDEVNALFLELIYGGDGAGRSSDRDGTREAQFAIGQVPIEHGTGDHHRWTDDLAMHDLAAPFREHREVPAHVTHAGDAIGDKERQNDVTSAGKPVAEGRMHMHIPEPRNEILTGGINNAGILRRMKSCRIGNRNDVISADDNCLILANRRCAGIDDNSVGNHNRGCRFRLRSAGRKEQGECDQCKEQSGDRHGSRDYYSSRLNRKGREGRKDSEAIIKNLTADDTDETD